MALVLVPFALLSWLLAWQRELRIGAAGLVVLFGVSRLFYRRHPRWIKRVGPSQLLLWSLLLMGLHEWIIGHVRRKRKEKTAVLE